MRTDEIEKMVKHYIETNGRLTDPEYVDDQRMRHQWVDMVWALDLYVNLTTGKFPLGSK